MADEILLTGSGSSADATASANELSGALDGLNARAGNLAVTAGGFARAMSTAFSQAAIGGRALDDVLKSLALRLSNLALAAAFKPVATGILGGLDNVFANLFGGAGKGGGKPEQFAVGGVKPFASGG